MAPERIAVAADMAWLLDSESNEFGRRSLSSWGVSPSQPLIGVNVVNENSCFDRYPEMASAVASSLDTLAGDLDAHVVFLCSEVREGPTFDKATAKQVISRMQRPDRVTLAPNHYFSPKQLMSIIGCCRLSISMRYHFCLFSALKGVPFVAIQRSDKVSDLCWDIGWQAAVLPPAFSTAELVDHAHRLTRDRVVSVEQLSSAVEEMRTRALRCVKTLSALRAPKPVGA